MTAENQGGDSCKCPFIESCALTQQNKKRMPNLVQRIREYYCAWESLRCARRWIYETLGKSFVPPLLLPNQWEWARQITIETDEENRLSNKTSPGPFQQEDSDKNNTGRI